MGSGIECSFGLSIRSLGPQGQRRTFDHPSFISGYANDWAHTCRGDGDHCFMHLVVLFTISEVVITLENLADGPLMLPCSQSTHTQSTPEWAMDRASRVPGSIYEMYESVLGVDLVASACLPCPKTRSASALEAPIDLAAVLKGIHGFGSGCKGLGIWDCMETCMELIGRKAQEPVPVASGGDRYRAG